MSKPLGRRQLTRVSHSFKRALDKWAYYGYRNRLSEMTVWLKHTSTHRWAHRLSRENVANLLHAQGWGPDSDNIWRPDNRLPYVKKYIVDPDTRQLTYIRKSDRS